MAVNDLITRLILQTKEFDGNLQRSQKEMKNFQKEISGKMNNALGSLNQGLGKVGLSLGSLGWGAAIAGGVQFAKMGIEASQQGEEFNRIITASKQTLEGFAQAVMSADFSAFNGGLYDAWNRAKDLADVLSVLTNMQLAKSVFDSRVVFEFNTALKNVSDNTLSAKERQDELNKAKELEIQLGSKSVGVQEQVRKAIEKTWEAETGTKITAEQIRNIAEMGDQYDIIYQKQQNLNEIGKKGIVDQKGEVHSLSKENKELYKAAREDLGQYKKDQIEFAKMWRKFNADERLALGEQLILVNQLGQQQLGYQQQLMNSQKSLTTEIKPSKSQDKTLKTLKDLQKESDTLKKKLASAADPYVIRQLNDELRKVEDTIKKVTATFEAKPLENNFKFNSLLASINGEIAKVKEQMKGAASLDEWERLDGKLKNLTKTYETLNTATRGGANITSMGVDITGINKEMQARVAANKEIAKSEYEKAQAAAKAANIQKEATYGLIGALGSAIEMNDLSAASFIRMVAQVLPQIAALVAARNTETVATTTSSGAAAGGIPGAIGGLAVGLGLVASILSATVKPKFAGGGIVGDQNLVRINSGEMILNHAQQSRLFNTLNAGRMNSDSGGQVQFVIRGQDLVGVQKNHNSKFGKNGSNY